MESIIQEVASDEENTTNENVVQSLSFQDAENNNIQSQHQQQQQNLDPEQINIINAILQKEPASRSNIDLIHLNSYLSQENQFFKSLLQDKGFKQFTKNETVFNYGDTGEFFYIMLKGNVGVLVPTDINLQFNNYFEILKFVIENNRQIIKYKDNHSRVIKKMIDIVGIVQIWNQKLKDITSLIVYLEDFKANIQLKINQIIIDSGLIEQQSITNGVICFNQQYQFLDEFQKQIRIQLESKKEFVFKISLSMLKESAQIGPGKSFGELSLITDKERSATIYAIDQQVIVATLTKIEYQVVIGDTFKMKMDKALESLQKFEIFRTLSQRRLTSAYYYLREKQYIRNQYLFKEGDQIDGIYLIVKGEVQKLKSTKTIAPGYNSDDQNDFKSSSNFKSQKNVVLSIISSKEIIGIDEIMAKDVCSEKSFMLYMSKDDFIERILMIYPTVKKQLQDSIDIKNQFYEKRQEAVHEHQQREEERSIKAIGQCKTNHKIKSLVDNQNEQGHNSQRTLNGKFDKLILQEFNAKMVYRRGGMSQEHLNMVQKAFNNDKLNLLKKDKNKKYHQAISQTASSEMKENFRQQQKSRDNLRSKQQKYLSPSYIPGIPQMLSLSKKGCDSEVKRKAAILALSTSKIDNFSPLSSMSVRGKQSENLLQKQFALNKYQSEVKSKFTIERITEELQRDINKDLEELRYDKERKQIMKYLKGFKYKEVNENKGESNGQHDQKVQDEEQNNEESFIFEIEDFERIQYLQKLKKIYLPQKAKKQLTPRQITDTTQTVSQNGLENIRLDQEKNKKLSQDSKIGSASILYKSIWKNFQNHQKNREEMNEIIMKQQESQIIRQIQIPNNNQKQLTHIQPTDYSSQHQDNEQVLQLQTQQQSQQYQQKSKFMSKLVDTKQGRNKNLEKNYISQPVQLTVKQPPSNLFIKPQMTPSNQNKHFLIPPSSLQPLNSSRNSNKSGQKLNQEPSLQIYPKISNYQQKQAVVIEIDEDNDSLARDNNNEQNSISNSKINDSNIQKKTDPKQLNQTYNQYNKQQKSQQQLQQHYITQFPDQRIKEELVQEMQTISPLQSYRNNLEDQSLNYAQNFSKGRKLKSINGKKLSQANFEQYMKQQTSNIKGNHFSINVKNLKSSSSNQHSSLTLSQTPLYSGQSTNMPTNSLVTPSSLNINVILQNSNHEEFNNCIVSKTTKNQQLREQEQDKILTGRKSLNGCERKQYGNLISSRSTNNIKLEGCVNQEGYLISINQQSSQMGGYSSLQKFSSRITMPINRRSVSPLCNKKAYESVYQYKKLNEIIPVKQLLQNSRERKQKKTYEHEQLKQKHSKDMIRIKKSIIEF